MARQASSQKSARNPNWTRDELILALDLYLREGTSNKNSPAIASLSELLGRLGRALGTAWGGDEQFRNANGVYMKLCNFLRLDPAYQKRGRKGLTRGNRLEQEVWNNFAGDRPKLSQTAAAIRRAIEAERFIPTQSGSEDEEKEFPEGAVLYRLHRSYERNPDLVRIAKRRAMSESGKLACEACGFEFKAVYGAIGDGFIECHHTVPVSTLKPGAITRVGDLRLLCANCHRIVHRRQPMLSVPELSHLVGDSRKS